jgi:hypothetical protein
MTGLERLRELAGPNPTHNGDVLTGGMRQAREVVDLVDAQAERIKALEEALRDAAPLVYQLMGDPPPPFDKCDSFAPYRARKAWRSRIDALLAESTPTPSWPSIAEGVR